MWFLYVFSKWLPSPIRPQRCHSPVPPLKELNVQGWVEESTDGEKPIVMTQAKKKNKV